MNEKMFRVENKFLSLSISGTTVIVEVSQKPICLYSRTSSNKDVASTSKEIIAADSKTAKTSKDIRRNYTETSPRNIPPTSKDAIQKFFGKIPMTSEDLRLKLFKM
jgi:hypothetical protein